MFFFYIFNKQNIKPPPPFLRKRFIKWREFFSSLLNLIKAPFKAPYIQWYSNKKKHKKCRLMTSKSSLTLEIVCGILHWFLLTWFKQYFLRNNNFRIVIVLPFPKCGLSFLCIHYYWRYDWFRSEWDIFTVLFNKFNFL